jgi:hypothetical protein
MRAKQSVQDGIDTVLSSRRALVRADRTVLELETEMMAMDLRAEMRKRVVETAEGKLIGTMFPDFDVTWYQSGRVGFSIVDDTLKGSIQVSDRGRIVLDRMASKLDDMLRQLDATERHRTAGPALAAIKLEAPA